MFNTDITTTLYGDMLRIHSLQHACQPHSLLWAELFYFCSLSHAFSYTANGYIHKVRTCLAAYTCYGWTEPSQCMLQSSKMGTLTVELASASGVQGCCHPVSGRSLLVSASCKREPEQWPALTQVYSIPPVQHTTSAAMIVGVLVGAGVKSNTTHQQLVQCTMRQI